MTYRNRVLLDLAHEAPCLLLPGQHECLGPPSEPCHSDMIRHGRGEHHKSHDVYAVPGCHNAHLAFTRANLGKDGYHAAWTDAMERYILWQWVSGKVRLADITQRPKETSMEAPMCKICEHRHYVRDPHQFGKNTSADVGKAPRGGERTPGRSGDCYGSRISAQAGETPAKNSPAPSLTSAARGAGVELAGIRGSGKVGSANCGTRTPGANSQQNGVTATRGGKNTRREGRRVLKAEAERPDATRTAATAKPDPLSPLPPARGIYQTRADKVTPGKRKTAPTKKAKKGKKKCK